MMTKCRHDLEEIKQIRKGYIYYKCKSCGDILVNEVLGQERKVVDKHKKKEGEL